MSALRARWWPKVTHYGDGVHVAVGRLNANVSASRGRYGYPHTRSVSASVWILAPRPEGAS